MQVWELKSIGYNTCEEDDLYYNQVIVGIKGFPVFLFLLLSCKSQVYNWRSLGCSVFFGIYGPGERMLFRGLPEILALDNATDPAEDQGASGRVGAVVIFIGAMVGVRKHKMGGY